jgi:O-acetyl-ADP-ribose deacetylase (regulator of RNase III)
MIKYIKSDLIKSDCDVIIHGCNCRKVMGAGIAKQIKATYPEAYEVDMRTTWGDPNKLGTFTYVKVPNKYFTGKDVYIVNAYTQNEYGREEGKVYADYKAIREVMTRISDFFVDTDDKVFKIGMPKIGAGLARGDWKTISEIINRAFADKEIYVYEWDNGEVKKEEFNLDRLREVWKEQLEGRHKAKNEKNI